MNGDIMPRRRPKDKNRLTLHKPTGQFRKRVHGKDWYFGTDPDAAMTEWIRVKLPLMAGLPYPPKPMTAEGVVGGSGSVIDLCNAYLHARRADVDAGKLTGRQWGEYKATAESIVAAFGRGRDAGTIGPADFRALLTETEKRLKSPSSRAKFVQMVRTFFRWGFEDGRLAVPARFGTGFGKPTALEHRRYKLTSKPRFITAADCWKLLDAAEAPMKAMILLALNAGLGPTDIAALDRSDLTHRAGWLEFARRKTGIPRRAKLWPETVEALAEVERTRPTPLDPADAGAIFITYKGRRWVRFKDKGPMENGVRSDAIGQHFRGLAKLAGVNVSGIYAMRHVAATILDEKNDPAARDVIMGHVPTGIVSVYRERVGDDRVELLCAHVRDWLNRGKTTS
jgi:integrase